MSQTVHVTLIGLNRATASIGQALRAYSQNPKHQLVFTVIGQDGDKKTMEAALHLGAVDSVESNAKSAIRYADVVFVSLPAEVIDGVYEYFSSALKAGTVVLDMSVGKVAATQLADKYFPRQPNGAPLAYLVGIQPLVATPFLYDTRQDVTASDPHLFKHSQMILAPQTDCPADAVKLASDLAAILEMSPHFMEIGEYEALASVTEQLPALLGLALFGGILAGNKGLERMVDHRFALLMHALRGTKANDLITSWTQHAASTQAHIDELIHILLKLRDLLDDEESDDLKTHLKQSLLAFESWEARRQLGKWDDVDTMPEIPNLFSSWFGFGKRKTPKTE